MMKRDDLVPPVQPYIHPYLTNVKSNEPAPSYSFPKLGNQPFVWIGTGALQNFKWIKEMVGSNLAKAKDPAIPQLFIVDNSTKVREFWAHLGTAFAASTTYEAFKGQISKMNAKLRDCAKFKGVEIDTQIIQVMNDLMSDNPVFWYNYFKKITANLTFICADWANPKVTAFINAKTDPQVPKYAYLSNIIEFIVVNDYNQATFDQIHHILTNLHALKNTQQVIHVRTRLSISALSAELDGLSYLPASPDTVLFIDLKVGKDEHFKKLDDPLYIPLDEIAFKNVFSRRSNQFYVPLDEKAYEAFFVKKSTASSSSVNFSNSVLISAPKPAQASNAQTDAESNESCCMRLINRFLFS